MKYPTKHIALLIAIVIAISGSSMTVAQTFDPELDEAVAWMFENDLTRYDNIEEYRPADTLTREQAAKFFGNFAIYDGKENVKAADECQFSDIAGADYTLTPHILSSCMLGIFKGSQGKFMPFGTLTRAEAITVVIRTVEGFQDETGYPRWGEYHKKARQLGLTDEQDVFSLDAPISRYEIALILYRASGDNTPQLTTDQSQAQVNELKDLLLALGLLSN